MDPFLRSFYDFNPPNQFQSFLRSLQIHGNEPLRSTLFLETPRRVTDTAAEVIHPMSKLEGSFIQELELYRDKLFSLFDRFVGPFYPARLSVFGPTGKSVSFTEAAAIYGLALHWRPHDPILPWAQFESNGVTRISAPDLSQTWQFVWQSISRELYAPLYSTLRACLLFMERERPKPYISDSRFDWTVLTTTVSLADTLGPHLNPDSWQVSPAEKSQ
jgi:hypothetical protein